MQKKVTIIFFLLFLSSIILADQDIIDETPDEDVVQKPFSFDIPDEREHNYCYCNCDRDHIPYEKDSMFYYTIKVQNWGNEDDENVNVKLSLESYDCFIYLENSTEILRINMPNGTDDIWMPIKDSEEGVSPLEDYFLVSEKLRKCDLENNDCPTILIRQKVIGIGGCPKTYVRYTTAIIKSDSTEYRPNSNVPLRLTAGCYFDECVIPDLIECKGITPEDVVPVSEQNPDDDSSIDDEVIEDNEISDDYVKCGVEPEFGCSCSTIEL